MSDIIKSINAMLQIPLKTYIFKQLKCLIFMVLYTIFSLAFPGFISVIVDEGIKSRDIGKILFYCGLMLCCGILMIVFQYLQKISFYKLAQEIVYSIKHTVFERLSERNLKFWSKYQVGDVLRVLENDINDIQNLLTSTISNLVINFFVAVGIGIVLIIINPLTGIAVLILSFVFAHIQRKLGSKIQGGMIALRTEMGELSSVTNEALNNMPVIQMAGLEELEKQRFDLKNKNVIRKFISQMKRITISQLIGMLFNVLGIFVVLGAGAYEVLNGKLSIGVLFSMTIYVQRLYGPIVTLGTEYINIKNTKPMIDKVQKILANKDSVLEGNKLWAKVRGQIEFVNVNFSYENKKVLHDFSMKIGEKSTVGIIGENGSGKSTIIRLLSKLCIPQKGMIYLDGLAINEISYESIKSNIEIIPQESFLPYGTVRNIMGINSKEKERILYELMEELGIPLVKFPEGLEAKISENASNLSGGEVQKLSLIRGLLQDKKVYILDEPTAAMDLESEKEFCKIIKKYLADKTVLIVTHRREVLSVCDDIIELKCEM